ncbi:glycoside hydrolase family protein [Pedobacter borealis]|uniref:glycoside hydrolase family protein n=1 Tax=Pedobacter borealis TaxID=475254 RepID=UPI000492F0B4|nr:glycoside hydrolase family protein [Pedobacter borealis]
MKKLKLICYIIFLLVSVSWAQNSSDTLHFKDNLLPISQQNIFKVEGYYSWCPSIIKTGDGKYHMFYSRWKKQYGFSGWLTFSEIAHATADQPAGPWKDLGVVLTARGKGYWDAINMHNPRIHYFDGKYYLYYISTHMDNELYGDSTLIENARLWSKSPNWMLLRNNQRTGVAVSKSINGPWKRLNQPIIEPSGPISLLTVNPTITKGADGHYYLIVKGDRIKGGGARNQALAIGKTPTGPFIMQPKPVIDYMNTEDMAMWYDTKRKYYYSVFHNDNIIYMVSSPDGINWQRATEFEILKPDILMADGSRFKPLELQRPFLYQENGIPLVLAVATRDKNDSYLFFIPIKSVK